MSRCAYANTNDRVGNLLEVIGCLDDHYPHHNIVVHGIHAEDVRAQLEGEGFRVTQPRNVISDGCSSTGVRETACWLETRRSLLTEPMAVYMPAGRSSVGIVFETDGRQVTSFRVGTLAAIALVEGCS